MCCIPPVRREDCANLLGPVREVLSLTKKRGRALAVRAVLTWKGSCSFRASSSCFICCYRRRLRSSLSKPCVALVALISHSQFYLCMVVLSSALHCVQSRIERLDSKIANATEGITVAETNKDTTLYAFEPTTIEDAIADFTTFFDFESDSGECPEAVLPCTAIAMGMETRHRSEWTCPCGSF